MGVQLTKSAVDLGIVVRDSDKALAFYRDVLGLEHVADIPMPGGLGGTMHRLAAGETVVKLVSLDKTPSASNPPGGLVGASGYRYFTLSVSNLDEVMAECEAAGVTIVIPRTEARPGVTIGMVEDPDGNWVEFVENS